jgi:5'-phosphate synthase pdxT subunit
MLTVLQVILALTHGDDDSRPPIEIIARLRDHPQLDLIEHASDTRAIVALRQGHHLVTTFHPELTKDTRFHEYFIINAFFRASPHLLC